MKAGRRQIWAFARRGGPCGGAQRLGRAHGPSFFTLRLPAVFTSAAGRGTGSTRAGRTFSTLAWAGAFSFGAALRGGAR